MGVSEVLYNINIMQFDELGSAGWLADIIGSLAGIGGAVLGIILFTLILKLITLPFDFFSKSSMRKNSLLMEKMRPELEKLQKQYENDKQLYNQKMMALYKKNGYSMMGACLPTILTLVIFILALNGFSTFSNFETKKIYTQMAQSYNQVVYDGLDEVDNYIIKGENGEFTIKVEDIYNKTMENDTPDGIFVNIDEEQVDGSLQKYIEISTGSYITYKQYYTINAEGKFKESSVFFLVNADKLGNLKNIDGKTFEEVYDSTSEITRQNQAISFLNLVRSKAAAECYQENKGNTKFLWIKNIWASDTTMAHPLSDTYEGTGLKNKTDHQELTRYLQDEITAPNGYFIMLVLTVGITVLMQYVTNKSQKAQMELQTVNGSGKSTQKMLTWLMPIMMAVFAFSSTSAFAIYLILSSAISILSTIIINKLVERKFAKKHPVKDGKTIRGRVYVKEEPKEEPKKKKIKNEVGPNDFMSAKVKGKNKNKADNSTYHIGGKLK